ncbi:hypothetical protein [Thalassovita sp.]|uniref:hypothetical protein n=1 Tax=Thalassovita sp. TaxID=1979401 RepID=UPI0029DE7320|nr:hypothetical protein [Thalassovita sp.]
MSDETDTKQELVTRRDVLKSVGKYSAAASGATLVVISATDALAQAAASNEWVCTDHYPWWVCWLLGSRSNTTTQNYGGWNSFPTNAPPADYGDSLR